MAEKKEKIIYISGHRNPDTDSICSAMALADLKNKISARQVADEHADRVVYKASGGTFESGNPICDEGI